MAHTPFNGDMFIARKLMRLIQDFGIQTAVETGTWSGHTTRELARMVPNVWTIDSTFEHLYEEFGPKARDDLRFKHLVNTVLGDSSIDLKNIIKKVVPPVLFYLDAHGGGANGSNVNPLLEELDQIGEFRWESGPVIAIHDFKVPGKEWGYNWGDWGRGAEPLSYELILSRLEKIYPKGHKYEYNEEAEGMQRGIIYVYPGGAVA